MLPYAFRGGESRRLPQAGERKDTKGRLVSSPQRVWERNGLKGHATRASKDHSSRHEDTSNSEAAE